MRSMAALGPVIDCPAMQHRSLPMKAICLGLGVLLAAVGPAASAQQLPDDPALRAQIRALDLAHAQAIFDGDTAALEDLLPDDHTVNHPTNRIVQEKAQLLAMIDSGVIRYTRFERRPEAFLFYPDLVVVMGDETVVPAAGAPGAGQVLRRRYTNGWMHRDGTWRLAFRHANNVAPVRRD
jgi:ketosteroid isomerase-like protein